MLTAVGRIALTRTYFGCPVCGTSRFGADAVLGLAGYLTPAAERLAVLAGVRQSFAKAEQLLAELCGWALDDETIRLVTQAAAGTIDVPIDAGKVNTTAGWRDVKVAVFAKRAAAAPATPAQWDERDVPPPAARTVVAAIEPAADFATRVRREADRLGVTTAPDVTVLADGAEWIWNLAADVVPQAAGVLDSYHASAHISAAAKAVWGDGTDATAAQFAAGRAALLADGKAGLEHWLAEAFGTVPVGVSTDPLLELAGYLAKHPTRLGYAERLAAGRSIGSGLVEGSIKQLVNLRLKRTGARWRAEHVGPLVEMIALADSPDWQPFWTAV